jgi:Hemerythrin HHE cation binding domain
MTTTGGGSPLDTSDIIAVHRARSGALVSASVLVGAAPAGDTDRTGLLGSYDDKVLRFLQVHHDGEDELMTPLLSECCTAEDAVVVRRVADQHGDVHGPIHDADDALRLWTASANPEAGADFVAALGRLHDALAPHLEDEETHNLPLVAAYLSAAEWGALAEHGLTSLPATTSG